MSAQAVQLARLALMALEPAERNALFAELVEAKITPAADDRIISRAEAAKRFGVTVHTIDDWARAGALKKIRLPGLSRSCGISARAVDMLLASGGRN